MRKAVIWKIVDAKKYAPNMNFGVAPLPYPEGGKPNATYVWGNYNIIPTNSKHPKEAWEFVKWMSGYGNEEWFGKQFAKIGGWNTVSPKVTAVKEFQDFMKEVPARKQLMELMSSENAQIFPTMPDQAYYGDRIDVAEQSVMSGQATAKQALEKVQQEIEKEIKRNKK